MRLKLLFSILLLTPSHAHTLPDPILLGTPVKAMTIWGKMLVKEEGTGVPILYAGTYTGKGNLFIAAALNRLVHEDIVDRSDILTKLVNYGDANGSGSTASKVSRVAFDDAMAAANADEVTALANTDLGTAAATITGANMASNTKDPTTSSIRLTI